jgi:hypothetical protein
MPRAMWPLLRGKPRIELALTQVIDGQLTSGQLLADTGAGGDPALFELILDEDDCLNCGGKFAGMITLRGAYSGSYPTYFIRIRIPLLGFDDRIRVVGVSTPPHGFDGIAGFHS